MYPHKLHFSPALDAADNEQRNRWFPGYDIATRSTKTKAPVLKRALDPESESRISDREAQEMDDSPLDTDDASHVNTDDD